MRSKFDIAYEQVMRQVAMKRLLTEDSEENDMLDKLDTAVTIEEKVMVAIGSMLQSPLTFPSAIGFWAIGKTGQSKRLFKIVGEQVVKHLNMFTGAAGGGTAGTTAGGAAGGAGGAVAGGVGAVPGAAGGGAAGGVAGGGIGGYCGFATRKAAGKLGGLLFGFLGQCNDYVSKEHKNIFFNLLKKAIGKGDEDITKESAEFDRCLMQVKSAKSNVIAEGVISSLAEKAIRFLESNAKKFCQLLVKYWNDLSENISFLKKVAEALMKKVAAFFVDFLKPILKTLFTMLKISIKNYKKFVGVESGEKMAGIIIGTYNDAASEVGLKDAAGFKPKEVLDGFFGCREVQVEVGTIFKKIVDTCVAIVKGIKKFANGVVEFVKGEK